MVVFVFEVILLTTTAFCVSLSLFCILLKLFCVSLKLFFGGCFVSEVISCLFGVVLHLFVVISCLFMVVVDFFVANLCLYVVILHLCIIVLCPFEAILKSFCPFAVILCLFVVVLCICGSLQMRKAAQHSSDDWSDRHLRCRWKYKKKQDQGSLA